MMRAPVGSSLKVSGIRMAVPAAGPEPGQHADQRAEDAADQREGEVLQAHRRRQARHQMLQGVHGAPPHNPNAPIGSGTLSQW